MLNSTQIKASLFPCKACVILDIRLSATPYLSPVVVQWGGIIFLKKGTHQLNFSELVTKQTQTWLRGDHIQLLHGNTGFLCLFH